MKSDLSEIPLRELLAEPLRNGLTRPKRVRGDGVPMVNMGELFSHRRIGDIEMERVRLNERNPERDLLQPLDLLFARQSIVAEGAGKASIFLGAREPVTFESHLIRARIDQAKVNPHWLFYFFESPQGRDRMRSIVTQVAAAGIRGSDLAQLLIPCPALDEQARAAAVLCSLDDKIDGSWRAARLLDKIGAAFFEHWLLSSMTRDTVAAKDRVRLLLGGTPARSNKRFWTGGTVPWIASAKANEFRILEPTAYITEEAVAKSATKLMPPGTTVVAITGATMGRVSRLEIGACANQSIVGLLGTEETPNAFLFYWLRSAIPELLSRQTGAAQQHVNKNDVGCLRMPVADRSSIGGLVAVLDPLLAQVGLLVREAKTLRAIRDALLPRLISRRRRIGDVDELGPVVGSTTTEVAA